MKRSKGNVARQDSKRRHRKVPLHKAMILAWKSRGCVTCGESDPVCIDAHHPDHRDKRHARDSMSGCIGRSTSRLLRMMEICVPLCRNCHAKLEWSEPEAWREKLAAIAANRGSGSARGDDDQLPLWN